MKLYEIRLLAADYIEVCEAFSSLEDAVRLAKKLTEELSETSSEHIGRCMLCGEAIGEYDSLMGAATHTEEMLKGCDLAQAQISNLNGDWLVQCGNNKSHLADALAFDIVTVEIEPESGTDLK